jgi:hypothetical protein
MFNGKISPTASKKIENKIKNKTGCRPKACKESLVKKYTRRQGKKKWFHPDSNRGPTACEADVITNYTMKPN